MADYQLTLRTTQGESLDITERVSSLTWSGSIKQVSRQLEATLVTPNDGRTPALASDLGSEVGLLVGDTARFLGNIVRREKRTGASTMEVTVLDRGRFLASNEGWYTFNGAKADAAVRSLCADFGVEVGALAAPMATVSWKFPGVALSKIVDTLYTLAGEQDGRRYLARFDGQGRLEVVEKPQTAALEIAPGKNLQTQTVAEDISSLVDRVAIYTDTGQLVRTVDDAESMALYGQLQRVLTQREGTDAGAEARALLEDNGLQQTITVECLGDPALISGNAVLLRENSTGVTGLCWIDSDTHTWKNGQYFCRLSLNFRNLMNETSAGQGT